MATNFPAFCAHPPLPYFLPSSDTQLLIVPMYLKYCFSNPLFAWAFPSANIGLSLFAELIYTHPLRISSGIISPASLPNVSATLSIPYHTGLVTLLSVGIKCCACGLLLHSLYRIMIFCSCICFPQYVTILLQYIICICSTEQSSWHTGGAK